MGIYGLVILDAVHGLHGPHRGQLPNVVFGLIEKYDQAADEGYEAILCICGSNGWPGMPPGSGL